jgi:hypothetical protein
MPNINAPSGLKPLRHLDGLPVTGALTKVFIPASDGVAVFIGDIVQYTGLSAIAGTIKFGEDVSGIPQVTRSTAVAAAWAGVVVGFKVNPDNLMQKHRAANTDRIAYICVDQRMVYEIQEDALVTPVPAASVGLNAGIVFTAGSTVTGVSGLVLDSDTAAVTAALPLKIIGLVKRPDNEFNSGGAGTDPAKFEVIINAPLNTGTPGTLGI